MKKTKLDMHFTCKHCLSAIKYGAEGLLEFIFYISKSLRTFYLILSVSILKN